MDKNSSEEDRDRSRDDMSYDEKLPASSPNDSDEQGLAVGKSRADSTSSAGTQIAERLSLTPKTSIPASVMTEGKKGQDLEKGPSGPKNATVDENGKIVVNWTSISDPENPKNWPKKKKIFNVIIISMMTFLCPLTSSMFVLLLTALFDDSLLVFRKSNKNFKHHKLSPHFLSQSFFSVLALAL
jgi:hypothetical protein